MYIDMAPIIGFKCGTIGAELEQAWIEYIGDTKICAELQPPFTKVKTSSKFGKCDAAKLKKLFGINLKMAEFEGLLRCSLYIGVAPDACKRLQTYLPEETPFGRVAVDVEYGLVIDINKKCVVGYWENGLKELKPEHLDICRALHLDYTPPSFPEEE